MRSELEIKVYMTKYYKIKIEQNKHKGKNLYKVSITNDFKSNKW